MPAFLTFALGAVATWALTGAWARPGHFRPVVAALSAALVVAFGALGSRRRRRLEFVEWVGLPLIGAVAGVLSVAGLTWRLIPPLAAAALAMVPRVSRARETRGRDAARPLPASSAAGPLAAYGVVAFAVAVGWAPIWILGVAFTAPLALRLRRHRYGKTPTPLTAEFAIAFTGLLTAGYLIEGLIR